MRKFLTSLLAASFAMLAIALPASAASYTGKAYFGIEGLYQGSNDLGTPQFNFPALAAVVLGSGTGDYQANAVFSDTRVLGASGTEDLDLAGVLVDPLGTVITATKVIAVMVYADPTNTNNVVVGNGTNGALLGFGALAHTYAVPPGGWFMVGAPKAGWTVTGATADILKITNSAAGSGVTYTIVILARV